MVYLTNDHIHSEQDGKFSKTNFQAESFVYSSISINTMLQMNDTIIASKHVL